MARENRHNRRDCVRSLDHGHSQAETPETAHVARVAFLLYGDQLDWLKLELGRDL